MSKVIAVLATLDTKGAEASYIREQLEALGSEALLVDIGVIGECAAEPGIGRAEVAAAGGTPLAELLADPTREAATPVMAAGATALLRERLEGGRLHGVLGLGGLQGTALCTQVMRELPYGFPKVMVSTVASGDTAAYVDIKDIAMLFSVSDILGLNSFTRTILARAAGAAHGMAQVEVAAPQGASGKPLKSAVNEQ